MKTTHCLMAALLATCLAAPSAFAQTAAGTNGGAGINNNAAGYNNNGAGMNNGAAGVNNNGAATANNNGAMGNNGAAGANGAANGNQRIGQEQAAGTGAIVTVAPSGVREVQQALNRLGYAAGTVNGVWDQATAKALVNFQQAHGLEPTGNLNFSSIAALGLWKNLIGDPLGNGNKALAKNSAVPPARGGKKSATVGGAPLPSQRITNESRQ